MAAQTFMRVIVPPNPVYDPLALQYGSARNHTTNKPPKTLLAVTRRRKQYKSILPDHAYSEGMSRNDIGRQLHRIEYHRMHFKEIEDMERTLGTGTSFDRRSAYNENFTQSDVLNNGK